MILEALKALGQRLQSEESDYKLTGCHHTYRISANMLPMVATAFLDRTYRVEMITCLDMRATENLFRLVYHFMRLHPADRHRVYVDLVPGEKPPTIADLFASANWYEREVYDMFGVEFEDHPGLTRILTEEGADYHPLLKDFGVATAEPSERADV